MNRFEWLAGIIGGEVGAELLRAPEDVSELRIRIGQRILLRKINGGSVHGEVVTAEKLQEVLQKLTEGSFYAHESEMIEGYFSIPGGFRAGVCGKMVLREGQPAQLTNVSSLCIRIPHEVRGCAQELAAKLLQNWPCSVLILSPPGMGKTTLLRDCLRRISDSGIQCALADERRELAACRNGIPQLDVGSNTDVMEGCPKAIALNAMIRSCAPQLVVLDEIGSEADAVAIRDAARCGVCVAASAHARSIDEILARRHIAPLIHEGIFDFVVVLGDRPGRILEIRKFKIEDGNGC